MTKTTETETTQAVSAVSPFVKSMIKGETYVINVPPSWILAGTAMEVTDTHMILKDSVYIESIGDGHSALGSVPRAKSAAELKAAAIRSYPIPDGMAVRLDAILISVPCARDMTPLSRAGEAEAIKKAAGR